MSRNKRTARQYDENKKRNGQSDYRRKPKGRSGKPSAGKEVEMDDNKSAKEKELSIDSKADYNDLTYYITNSEILKQATQLSFQNFIGGKGIDNYPIPSIMQIFMSPSPGLTWQGASPSYTHPDRSGLMMAATKLFNKLSMSSGRNMAYAPQDVAMCILAMSQLLAIHSYVKRLFRSIQIWNQYNRMMPKAIIEAQGIDWSDFMANYSNYRTAYNAMITTVNQLPIFMNCGYLRKSATQYLYLFTDTDSPMSQMYMYLPYCTWIIDESSYQGGTIMKTVPVVYNNGTTRTFGDILQNVVYPMVYNLIQSSTLNLVYADLLNLASKDSKFNFIALDYIIDGEAMLPIHNWEALVHIHNLTAMGYPDAPSNGTGYTPSNDVYPDAGTNNIKYQPAFSRGQVSTGSYLNTILFDSPISSPDEKIRLEMSRYKSAHSNNVVNIAGTDYFIFSILTDYWVNELKIIQNDVSQPYSFVTQYSNTPIQLLNLISQFDWAPNIVSYQASDGAIGAVHGDLNYFTTTPLSYIERLNEIIYLGLFDIQ